MADQLDQSIHSRLLKGNDLSDSDIAVLRNGLVVKKIDELRKIVSSLSVHLTGSTRKKDIVDRIVGMAQIGAVNDSSGEESDSYFVLDRRSKIFSQEFAVAFKCYAVEQEVEWRLC